MINLVKENKMEVSLFEINKKGFSYTIETIKYFKNKYPNDKLYLIIGSDNINKLNKWKNIKKISTLSQIIVFKREEKISNINIKKYNCQLLNNTIFNYSSKEFKKGDFNQISLKVNQYIANNFLYILDILLNMVNVKRYKHSIAVSKLAVKYAKQIGYDAKKAWFAGIVHDITKNKSLEWHRGFLSLNNRDGFKVLDHTLHSLSGYYWLKNKYLLKDQEILNSVKNHTNLAKKISILDKIIFAADKLCAGRKFLGIQKIRKIILKDFEKGFKLIVKNNYLTLLENQKEISKKQKEIYEKLI